MRRLTIYTLFVLSLLAPVATGFAIYYYLQASKDDLPREMLTGAAQADEVITAVEKLAVLPEGEAPTVATVTDLEKLDDQPFFKNAKVGYKLLIYAQAHKAILYDPTLNKIVEIAPLTATLE